MFPGYLGKYLHHIIAKLSDDSYVVRCQAMKSLGYMYPNYLVACDLHTEGTIGCGAVTSMLSDAVFFYRRKFLICLYMTLAI